MLRLSKKASKSCRGIIVWDFDGVLFDIKRLKKDSRFIFRKHGVSPTAYEKMVVLLKKEGGVFSLTAALRVLYKMGFGISEKRLRSEFHEYLRSRGYLDPRADKLLHELRKKGFSHFILSFGIPAFQYKKIHVGCGRAFRKHFEAMRVTQKPKFLFIKRIVKTHHGLPVIFIDDTREHIDLVKKNLPGVKTIFYNRKSLEEAARLILKYAK